MSAQGSVQFKLRFLPISEESKAIVTQIGKKHILDLTLKVSQVALVPDSVFCDILRHLLFVKFLCVLNYRDQSPGDQFLSIWVRNGPESMD